MTGHPMRRGAAADVDRGRHEPAALGLHFKGTACETGSMKGQNGDRHLG